MNSVCDCAMLAFSISPSLHWKSLSNEKLNGMSSNLTALGFCWQFLPCAGDQINALASNEFAKKYRYKKVMAYVNEIEEKDEENEYAHYARSLDNYIENLLSM